MKCACKGAFLERFVQPSILMFLSRENLHGFSILKKLEKSKVANYTDVDPTGLYRTLKKMETAGLLVSNWDMGAGAQPRRIYQITKEGRQCLASWEKTLKEYAVTIGSLSRAVSKSIRGAS
ncbi:MAG: helix-turn-helix transcriptional regulator [Kiritimatiellaeota bacterium]|nr:helix-turn-helix transcriptional regulator [Kiritimatiellota bacterium]